MLMLVSVLLSLLVGVIWGATEMRDIYKKKAKEDAVVEFDGEMYKFVKVGR